MGRPGRVSADAQSVAVAPGFEIKRPEPPDDLTPEEAAEWRAVVNRMPPDYFPREMHALLVQYCRITFQARIVMGRINTLQKKKDKTERDEVLLERLLKVHVMESKAMAFLSQKMRLCQASQKRVQDSRKSPVKAEVPPWAMDDAT